MTDTKVSQEDLDRVVDVMRDATIEILKLRETNKRLIAAIDQRLKDCSVPGCTKCARLKEALR